MRDAVKRLGGNPDKINPICPSDLVIDHSIQADFTRRYNSIKYILIFDDNVFTKTKRLSYIRA